MLLVLLTHSSIALCRCARFRCATLYNLMCLLSSLLRLLNPAQGVGTFWSGVVDDECGSQAQALCL